MHDKPVYLIERRRHGWLIVAAPGVPGVPVEALSECAPLFPPKAVLLHGVAEHYNRHHRVRAHFAVASPKEGERWLQEIRAALTEWDRETAWWHGVDVGMSSAAIFAVLCSERFRHEAKQYSEGATPRDAADFARCKNLLKVFPEFRSQLARVAEAYPGTDWPRIIGAWDRLEQMPDRAVGEFLQQH